MKSLVGKGKDVQSVDSVALQTLARSSRVGALSILLCCGGAANAAAYKLDLFGVPTGNTPVRANIADYTLHFVATFEIDDAAIAPNAFVSWQERSFQSFSVEFDFDTISYYIDKSDDPLNVGGHRSDLGIPLVEQIGVVFDESGVPARFGNPFHRVGDRFIIRDSDPRFDFYNPRLTFEDQDDFDRILLPDGSITQSTSRAAQGVTPSLIFGGVWRFESGDSIGTAYPNNPATGIYVISALAPVPEVGSLSLLAIGGFMTAWHLRRKRPRHNASVC